MIELTRYGIEWAGPREPISKEMSDGYWTPWHIAQEEINKLIEERNNYREGLFSMVKVCIQLQEDLDKARQKLIKLRDEQ